MKSFFDKESYTIDDVRSLINNQVEETIYLEFKEARALDMTDRKKLDISKDVSSFANSDGGIIIYGVVEQDHKAAGFSFVDGNTYSKEWLEQVINSGIQKRIQNIQILPIRENGDLMKTIYLVKIPASYDAPHLSKDKKFYRRFNFQAVELEEYEIRQLYARARKSKLEIDNWFLRHELNYPEDVAIYFDARIFNVGEVYEPTYKLNVILIGHRGLFDVTWKEFDKCHYTLLDNDRLKISSLNPVPIYPSETVTVIRFELRIKLENLILALNDTKLEVTLFYSCGMHKMEGDFHSLLTNILGHLQMEGKKIIAQ